MVETSSAPSRDRQFAYSRSSLERAVKRIDLLLNLPRRADESKDDFESEQDFLMRSYCLVRIRERIASTPPGAFNIRKVRACELAYAREKSRGYWNESDG